MRTCSDEWRLAATARGYNDEMVASSPSLLNRYLRHRRRWEVLLWVLLGMTVGLANSVVSFMDLRRHSQSFDWREPLLWEYSSIAVLLALVPVQLSFEQRFPVRIDTWRRALLWHLAATVPYSLIHVHAMMGLRQLAYSFVGGHYDSGDWLYRLWYEYLKDVRTYALVLGIVSLYRLVLLRLQGEARLLSAPDTDPPARRVQRPEQFLVRKLGAEFLVAAHDIEWLEAAENYVNLHVGGRVYPLRSTMTAIQEQLDPEHFVRVHRSHIVNLDFLMRIEPLETGDARLLLKNGMHIPCSRRYRPALKDALSAVTQMTRIRGSIP